MSLLAAAAGTAILTPGLLPSSKGPSRSSSAGLLTVDYRADDPDVFLFRDVVVGNVDATPELEIVRVGNTSGVPEKGNITVSRFSSGNVMTNLSSAEENWAKFTRVQLGDFDADPPLEIAVAGSLYDFTDWRPTVWLYQNSSPVLLTDSFSAIPSGESYLWGLDAADVDQDGITEYVAAGQVGMTSGTEHGLVMIGNHTPGVGLRSELVREGTVNGVIYWDVTVAELGGPPGPEIILVGEKNDWAYIQLAKWDGSTFTPLPNATFRTHDKANIYSVQVSDIDRDFLDDIVTVGEEFNTTTGTKYSEVSVWTWDGGPFLVPKADRQWTGSNGDASAYDIAVMNITGDADDEIMSIGHNRNSSSGNNMSGELNVMNSTLYEVDQLQWTGSDTNHWGLDSADADGDGQIEIVSVGTKTTISGTTGETQIAEVPEFATALVAPVVTLLPLLAGRQVRRELRREGRRLLR